MNRKTVAIMLSLLIIAVLATATMAGQSVKIVIDGKELNGDVQVLISNNQTMVPLRVIAENLGAVVTWDNNTRTVNIRTPQNNELKLLKINGEATTWPYWVKEEKLYMEYRDAVAFVQMQYNPLFSPVKYSFSNQELIIGNRITAMPYETRGDFRVINIQSLQKKGIIDYTWDPEQQNMVVKSAY